MAGSELESKKNIDLEEDFQQSLYTWKENLLKRQFQQEPIQSTLLLLEDLDRLKKVYTNLELKKAYIAPPFDYLSSMIIEGLCGILFRRPNQIHWDMIPSLLEKCHLEKNYTLSLLTFWYLASFKKKIHHFDVSFDFFKSDRLIKVAFFFLGQNLTLEVLAKSFYPKNDRSELACEFWQNIDQILSGSFEKEYCDLLSSCHLEKQKEIIKQLFSYFPPQKESHSHYILARILGFVKKKDYILDNDKALSFMRFCNNKPEFKLAKLFQDEIAISLLQIPHIDYQIIKEMWHFNESLFTQKKIMNLLNKQNISLVAILQQERGGFGGNIK